MTHDSLISLDTYWICGEAILSVPSVVVLGITCDGRSRERDLQDSSPQISTFSSNRAICWEGENRGHIDDLAHRKDTKHFWSFVWIVPWIAIRFFKLCGNHCVVLFILVYFHQTLNMLGPPESNIWFFLASTPLDENPGSAADKKGRHIGKRSLFPEVTFVGTPVNMSCRESEFISTFLQMKKTD